MPKKNSLPLVLDLLLHFFSTLFFAGFIYYSGGSFSLIIAVLCGGIFIDLDHFLDYMLYYRFRWNFQDFIETRFLLSGKVYVILHGWEIVSVFLILGIFLNSAFLIVFSSAMGMHIFIDHIQRYNPLFYFLSYRIFHRFSVERIAPELLKKFSAIQNSAE